MKFEIKKVPKWDKANRDDKLLFLKQEGRGNFLYISAFFYLVFAINLVFFGWAHGKYYIRRID